MRAICATVAAAFAFSAVPATHHFMNGQKAKIKGVIMSRDGDTLKLREGGDLVAVVALDDTTKVQVKKGAFKFRREDMDMTALVPGLRVDVDGVGNGQGELSAEKNRVQP
jgi:hypothetical protein